MAEGQMNPVGESKPNPDPTGATTEAVERAVRSERDYVDGQVGVLLERLRGIDLATALLSESAAKVPDITAKAVHHLRELVNEQFAKVSNQFVERDIRAEREARDNKVAVDAAFAAQKEAAAKQDEANAKAIDKSENSTAETIKTNSELSRTTNDALRGQLEDLKERVSRIESSKAAQMEGRTESRAQVSTTTTVVGAVIGAVLFALALYAALKSNEPMPPALIDAASYFAARIGG